MKTTYAFTLSGETRVYLLGTASNPVAAAEAEATKVCGSPVVYRECREREATLEAYIVADDFDGEYIDAGLDPEYWLALVDEDDRDAA